MANFVVNNAITAVNIDFRRLMKSGAVEAALPRHAVKHLMAMAVISRREAMMLNAC